MISKKQVLHGILVFGFVKSMYDYLTLLEDICMHFKIEMTMHLYLSCAWFDILCKDSVLFKIETIELQAHVKDFT